MMTKNNAGTLANMALTPLATTRVRSPGLEPLNSYELQAIEDLCAWVAEEQDAAPETVRSVTEAHFGTGDVTALARKDYDEVIRFLMDLRMDDMRE